MQLEIKAALETSMPHHLWLKTAVLLPKELEIGVQPTSSFHFYVEAKLVATQYRFLILLLFTWKYAMLNSGQGLFSGKRTS